MKLWMLAGLLAVLLPAPDAIPEPGAKLPDQWAPFSNQRVVSPSGRRYVVVRKKLTSKAIGIEFELCERRAGAPPINPAKTSSLKYPRVKPVDISRDPKDRLLAKGFIGQMPLEVRVLDKPGGFILFEQYGRVGYGKAVTYVDGQGEIRFSHSVEDIYGHYPNVLPTVSSIWWHSGFWIDEGRESVTVASRNDELREISLINGEVRTPTAIDLIRWFDHGTLQSRCLALDVGTRLEASKLLTVAARAEGLARDSSQALSIRLRAAVITHKAGRRIDFKPLVEDALTRGQAPDDLAYAIKQLNHVYTVGDELEALRRALDLMNKRSLWQVSSACQEAFVNMGAPAVPALCEMLLERNQSGDFYSVVVSALQGIRSKRALPALEEALSREEPDSFMHGAIDSAIKACSN